jgi:uncharacterized lipoprotein YehR (DUF1307 family)
MKISTDTIKKDIDKVHSDLIDIYHDLPREVGEALHYDMTYAIEDIKEAIETLKISIDRANGIWED